MLTLDPKPTFKATVDIPRPGDSAVPVTFVFKHKTLKDYFSEVAESKEKAESILPFMERFVDSWEGQNINEPYSPKALEKLMTNYPRAGRAIFNKYREELLGDVELKNL